MKLKSVASLLALTAWGLTLSLHAASHTWSGAVNGYFSNAGNWSSGGVPTLAETNTISFSASATRTTVTNDIGALKISAFTFAGSNYIVRGASTITVEPSLISINCQGSSNTIESSLSFISQAYVIVGAGDSLILSGMLSGTNGLAKNSTGRLHFKGSASNPLSGDLIVLSGELHFQKTGGASPYNGNSITIGTTDVTDPTQLFLYANDQIPDGADISIQPSGALVMNNFTDSVNSVTMYSGTLDTGTGTLGIYDSLNLSPRFVGGITYESPTITGAIGFQNGPCTILVTSNTCNIAANIVNIVSAATINKTGAGTLGLNGSGNSFTGALNINQGRVIAGTSSALGTIAGATTVASGATLEMSSGINTSEPLNLTGLGTDGQGALQASSATCSGIITLTNETGISVKTVNDTLALSGPISGPGGIRKLGDGNLSLAGFGNNSFAGSSFVAKGTLTLGKSANVRAIGSVAVTNGAQLVWGANEQIDNAAVLTVYGGGSANLNNRNESIGGLNIGGTLDTGTGTLTLLGNVFMGRPYATNNAPPAVLRGNLSLGGAMRSVISTNYDGIMFDCAISDGAGVGGLNLSVGGTMGLLRSNSFTGPVWLTGTCIASNAFAFGAPGGNIFATNAIITLALSNLVVSGESLTAAGGASVGFFGVGSNVWNGNISIVDSNTAFYFSGWDRPESKSLTINGTISGSCDKLYVDAGKLILTASNSFSGTTLIGGGPLFQQDSGGKLILRNANALGSPGKEIIVQQGATLRLELPDGVSISGKSLSYEGVDETDAPFLVQAGAVSNNWNGPISMTGSPSRISVLDFNGRLKLNTVITGGGSLAKTGLGQLILAGNGTNQLSQLVAEHGLLRLAQTGGYALPTGDVVVLGDDLLVIDGIPWSSPASIQLEKPGQLPPSTSLNLIGPEGNINLNDQNLTVRQLSGSGAVFISNGTLTFSNAPGEFSDFSGLIDGNGGSCTNLIKQGAGALYLHGPSFTYTSDGSFWFLSDSIKLHGGVQVHGGFLSLTNGDIGALQIAPGTTVATRSAPTLGADPSYQNGLRLGSLSGGGNFSLINGAWVYVGNDNTSTIFDGAIDSDSAAKITKTGTGALTLNGSGTAYTGNVLVEQGALLVNAQFNCSVLVQRKDPGMTATLGGTGQVGNVTLTSVGARIAPGATTNTPSYGKLTVNNLTAGSGTSFQCEIGGTNAGVNLDQINATGTVTLSGGFAEFTAFGTGTVSNRYAVVKSVSAVSGTFSGDPEGDTIIPAAGRSMTITYLTSAGKEITLIEQPGANLANINITSIVQAPGGQVTLTGAGNPGSTYFIEANTNLATTNWITLGSVTGGWNGGISFTDTNAPNFPQRFYRFKLQ